MAEQVQVKDKKEKEKKVGAPATQKKWVLVNEAKRLKTPKILSKDKQDPLIKQKQIFVGKEGRSRVQWYILHYEEVKTKDQPYHKGEIIARIDVVHSQSGIMIQNVGQVKFENGTAFLLPIYRQLLIRDGYPKNLAYLRFQRKSRSDMFQLAMEDLVKELLAHNPGRFNGDRCTPQIPDETRQRCHLLIDGARERARLRAEDRLKPPSN